MTQSGPAILVVEDSATQLEQLAFFLERSGFSVLTARDGQEALAALETRKVDMVISDVVMPRMDGYQLCRALRANPELAGLPVILLTALLDPRDALAGLECGATNLLRKPYQEEFLLSRIRSILASQELRKQPAPEGCLQVVFAGQPQALRANTQQALDMLLSAYEDSAQHNLELARMRDELREFNEQLERRVGERTAALVAEIAARREIEQALRTKEERFAQVAAQVGDFIWEIDAAGVYTYASPGSQKLFGYTPEELVGQVHAYDLFCSSSADIGHTMERFARRAPYHEHLLWKRHKDGHKVLIESNAAPMVDSGGRLLGYRGTDRDVTERMEVREAERHSRLLATAVAEATLDFLTRSDLHQTSLLVVERALRLTDSGLGAFLERKRDGTLALRGGPWFASEGSPCAEIPLFREILENERLTRIEDPGALAELGCCLPSEHPSLRNLLAVRVTHGTSVLGALLVANRADGYRSADESTLTTLANVMALTLGAARDLEDRRAAQDSLADAKQRLDLVVQQSPLAVIEWDLERRACEWNRAAEETFGFTREEMLGKAWTFLVTEAFRPEANAVWDALLANRGGRYVVASNLTKDGREITCEWFNGPLTSPTGEVLGVVSLCRDVTQIRATEEQANKLLRALEQSPLPVSICSREGALEWLNPAFTQVNGYTLEEAAGKYVNDLVGVVPDDPVWEALDRSEVWQGEMPVRPKTGPQRWAYVLVAPVRDSRGEVTHLVAFQQDNSARKEMEEQLAASEEKLKRIFASMQDGFLESLDGRVTLANPAAARLLGVSSPEALVGYETAAFFVDPADPVAIRAGIDQDSLPGSLRMQIRRLDGALRTFEGSIVSLAPRLNQAIFRDITDRLRMEEESRARQAAETANRLRGEFLANMSHEIRTPLHTILSMVYLTMNTELTERQQDYLKHVQSAGQSLMRIVNDILDFSKIEAGRLELVQTDFSLEAVLDNLKRGLEPSVEEKGLELSIELAPEVPRRLVGDPLRLGQILLNLVGNAVKFTREGRVEVRAELEKASAGAATLRFRVSDTGIGMSSQQLAGLFIPFQQADSSITRQYGGTGLGLAICRRLVHLMQGQIEARSELGKGSTFLFTVQLGLRDVANLTVPQLQGRRAWLVDLPDETRSRLEDCLSRLSIVPAAEPEEGPVDFVFVKRPPYEARANGRFVIRLADPGVSPVEPGPGSAHAVLPEQFSLSQLVDLLVELIDPASNDLRTRAQAPPQLRGGRVLVVEDNPVNQRIARELLESAGLTVDVADDGEEAMRRLREAGLPSPWGLVLMDVQMPRMDGYTATVTLRADPRFERLPIVAMTAHALSEERHRCLAAGMNDYLSKPIDPEKLYATITRWLEVSAPAQERPSSADFPSLEGVNVSEGLARVAGNAGAYRDLLLHFSHWQAGVACELSAALAGDDRARAQELAHALRGAAANLGLEAVARQAALMESGDLTVGPALLDRLASTARSLQETLRFSPPTAETLDSEQVERLLAELTRHLQASEGAALQKLPELRGLLEGRLASPELDLLAQHILQFEYEAALIDLMKIRTEIAEIGV